MSSLARGHAGVPQTERVTACEPSLLDVFVVPHSGTTLTWGWRHARGRRGFL